MPQYNEDDFEQSIIKLAATVAGSVGYIEEQIVFIIEGFLENNPSKIDKASGHFKSVKKLGNETIQRIVETIIKFKPKGKEAKLVISSWRISASLERISMTMDDCAVRMKGTDVKSVNFFFNALQNMGDLLLKQTFDLVIAYTTDKTDLFEKITNRSNQISSVYKVFFKEALKFHHENPDLEDDIINILSIAKNIDMIGIYINDINQQLIFKNKNI